jgi:hypothetical protein
MGSNSARKVELLLSRESGISFETYRHKITAGCPMKIFPDQDERFEVLMERRSVLLVFIVHQSKTCPYFSTSEVQEIGLGTPLSIFRASVFDERIRSVVRNLRGQMELPVQ